MIEDCTAIILAGGESKRMGQDKASVKLAGKTLLARAIANLQPLFEDIIISVREPIKDVGLPQLCDVGQDRAPMMGIYRTLDEVKTNWVFVVAVDMPFVSADLVKGLANKRGNHQLVAPMFDGHVQPLFAYYAKGCLPVMQQQISDNQRSLRRLIERMDSLIVQKDELETFDAKLLSFLDLDSQHELEYAENLLKTNQNR
ncbi:MAG TPA: molybdenum cofactor guanylyltransferase [Ghiorsea sp.]|nr:molybdenum cofactor guanylyltransferase [Ghiorsea sp.]HIP07221.1 molybdenum cofactor guanylyltransferase [Mariprofundaceae bacterium]